MQLGMSLQDVGKYHHETLLKVAPDIPKDDEQIKAVAKRCIEEMVELALECGLSAAHVFEHVSDALHNESNKRDAYPSDFQGFAAPSANANNIAVEIGDVMIGFAYLQYLLGIGDDKLGQCILDKIELCRLRARDGELVVYDRRLYKKSANRLPKGHSHG
jgi:hypothetical protein